VVRGPGWWLTCGVVGLTGDGASLGGSYGGTCITGGYTIGFVTGTAGSFDRVDALENALRNCLGLPPGPAAPD